MIHHPNNMHTGGYIIIKTYGNLQVRLTAESMLYAVKRVRKTMGFDSKWRINWADLRAQWIPASELEKGDCMIFPYPRIRIQQAQYDLLDYVKPTKGFRCSKCGYEFIMRTPTERYVKRRSGRTCNGCHKWDKNMIEIEFKNVILMANNKIRLQFGNNLGLNRYIQIDHDLAKFVGFYIAEGSTGAQSGFIEITQCKNMKVFAEICDITQRIFGTKISIDNRRDGKRMIVCGRLVARFLETICGKGAYYKRIPREILYTHNLDVLRTLVDYMVEGDGTKCLTYTRYITVSELLAWDLKTALVRLGFRPNLSKRPIREKSEFKYNYPQYNLCWCHDKRNYRHSNKSWNGIDGIYYLIRGIESNSASGQLRNKDSFLNGMSSKGQAQ